MVYSGGVRSYLEQDMRNKIRVPAPKLETFIKKAYELSQPQGLGFLHAKPGELDTETMETLIAGHDAFGVGDGRIHILYRKY